MIIKISHLNNYPILLISEVRNLRINIEISDSA